MSGNKVDYYVALEVASHEALIRQTYKDGVGVLTWDVGMTNATGHTVERYIGKPASLQHCMNLYVWALTNYAKGVNEAFEGHELTDYQFAAAMGFHWNTGAIKRAAWVKKFLAGDTAGARKAFMNYKRPPSIIPRRRKERDLFFDGKWSNNGTMTEYTRVTSSMSPVWSSAKSINVEKELRAAFQRANLPVIDVAAKPDNKPSAPTLSPTQKPADKPNGSQPTAKPKKPKLGLVGLIIGVGLALAAFGQDFIHWIQGSFS